MADRACTGPRYRVLLTEGSSASSRQVLTLLAHHGHTVGVMDSGGLSCTTWSRWVARRHKSPPFSADPMRYLEVLRDVLAEHWYDVLLPTHEQLVGLAGHKEEFGRLVSGLAVPRFEAVREVMDKAAAVRLFQRLGLPQPQTTLVTDEGALLDHASALPVYVKLPIATASRGVWLAEHPAQLVRIAGRPQVRSAFATGGEVLVQQPVRGPVVMVQALFDQGVLVGIHTSLRRREGVQSSSSSKESVVMPDVVRHLARLGAALAWHGPISLDAVLDEDFDLVRYVDVNPRMVEPVNAELAGADLVRRWLAVSRAENPGPLPKAHAGVRTHMLLMAVVRHGEAGRGRWAVLRELAQAATRTGWYAGSREELLPLGSDPGAALPLGFATAGMLLSPKLWQRIAGTDAPAHSLTPQGWRQLLATQGP